MKEEDFLRELNQKLEIGDYEAIKDLKKQIEHVDFGENLSKEEKFKQVEEHIKNYPELIKIKKKCDDLLKNSEKLDEEIELQIRTLENVLGSFSILFETALNPYASDYCVEEAFENVTKQLEESLKDLDEKSMF